MEIKMSKVFQEMQLSMSIYIFRMVQGPWAYGYQSLLII